MKLLLAVAFFLAPCASLPARSAEQPEGAYAKYHRAVIAGDLDGMLEQSLALQREDMKHMSPANREAALKMAQAVMPRVFTLERRTLGTDGRATLIVSGPWSGPNGMVQVYGTVPLLMENGEWKVIGVSWTTERPAILSAPPPAAAPAAAPAAGTAAAQKSAARTTATSTKGAPVVGSMSSEVTGRKFGAAKPECVFKPVMTAQDMENCK